SGKPINPNQGNKRSMGVSVDVEREERLAKSARLENVGNTAGMLSACKLLTVIMAAISLPACVNEYLPYPKAVMTPGTVQIKLQSAAHWELLAGNEAQYIVDAVPAYATLHVMKQSQENLPAPLHAYHQ